MNTALFERMHQQFKAGIQRTNRKNIARDLLEDAAVGMAINLSGFANENSLPSDQVRHRPDMRAYGKPLTVAWNKELQEQVVATMQLLGFENWNIVQFYKCYSGFYLGGHRIAIGNYVRFSCSIGLLYEYEDIWAVICPDLADFAPETLRIEFIARLESVVQLEIQVVDSTAEAPQHWAKLGLLYAADFKDVLQCPAYTEGPSIWLPLCEAGGLQALELVHVLQHPSFSNLLLHNRWLRHLIKAYDKPRMSTGSVL
jgi:hypothetical protein